MGPNPPNRHFSEPFLTTISINIEGISDDKEELLALLCKTTNCDVLCVQETHRDLTRNRPNVSGMKRIVEVPHLKHGSVIFARNDLVIKSSAYTNTNEVEALTIELQNCTVTSVYKPPGKPFVFLPPANFATQDVQIVLGDFNSHSETWGYSDTDANGHLVEEWAEDNHLSLIHDPKLPKSFYSKIWRREYNPDICFVSSQIGGYCLKEVYDHIPKSQHRPIGINVYAAIKTVEIPFRRRFNFKKANWRQYSEDLDRAIVKVEATPQNYDLFVETLRKISRKHIPRGCRTNYVPGLKEDSQTLMTRYKQLFEEDPLGVETIACADALMRTLSEERQRKWIDTLEKMDMTHSSKIAWNLLRKLNCDRKAVTQSGQVTPNQIAHQLLLNGKTTTSNQRRIKGRNHCGETLPDPNSSMLQLPFSLKELNIGINSMKNGKAAGEDDICTEQIKHFGDETRKWILKLFDFCKMHYLIPKLWRKSKVVALLKPGKPADEPCSYRPISLLSHLYKLYERMVLNRIQPVIEQKLIPMQAGFRAGKNCTGQVLQLTELIENGFQENLITGVVYIDLTAAYDTVNHKMLQRKLIHMTKDVQLAKVVQSLLQNRRFYVSFEGKKSRWRNQRNGLPQGSVLSPLLFNIYSNDQPILPYACHFLYADDLALAVQDCTFHRVEKKLEDALRSLTVYYRSNSLKPNPSKTVVCAYHLKTHDAKRKLEVRWDNVLLTHSDTPKYLGVTLDRTLTYRAHCQNTFMKVKTRNNLLRKLRGSKWGAKPSVLVTTAKALCYSSAEYACPVWNRSAHAKKVDTALNETCRIITGCMKPTPLEKLRRAAGIEAPHIRRSSAEYNERFRQVFDPRHVMYGHDEPPAPRLKSRKGFLHSIPIEPPTWFPVRPPTTSGIQLDWNTWSTLNQLRTGVAPTRKNRARWGQLALDDTKCECGVTQDNDHLLECVLCPTACTLDDLWECTDDGVRVAEYWAQNLR